MSWLYDLWAARVKGYRPVRAIPSPTHWVDANRGNDSNAGTSKAQAWASLTKVRDSVLPAGSVIALANDSTFALTDRLVFTTTNSTQVNGTSDGVPWILTNYDPGGYPTQRPTITYYYAPTAGQWTFDSGLGLWYYTHPQARTWGWDTWIKIAGRFGENWITTGTAALTQDYRCVTGTTQTRFYVYSPASTNPTTYYGGPGSILIGEGDSGALLFSRCGQYAILDNIAFTKVGTAIQQANLSGTQNLTGFQVQNCQLTDGGMLFKMLSDTTSTYTMTARAVENTIRSIGSGAIHWYGKANNCQALGNSIIDPLQSHSGRGIVYAQEGSGGTTALSGNLMGENYVSGGPFNKSGLSWDSCALYTDPGARGWTIDRNYIEGMHKAFTSNNGLPVTISRNICNDVDVLMHIGDEASYNSINVTITDNTMRACGLDKWKNGSAVGDNLGLVTLVNTATAGSVVTMQNNSFELVTGKAVPMLYARNDTTATLAGNHVTSNVTYAMQRADGSTSDTGRVTADLQIGAPVPPLTSSMRGAGTHIGYRLDAAGRPRANPPTAGAFEAA